MKDNPFNVVKDTQTLKVVEPIVKAEKKLHKSFMYGHISNGNGIIKLSDGYALKITALDKNFLIVQLLDYGKNMAIKTQSWQKAKLVEREKKETINFQIEPEDVENEDLFD